MTCTNSCNFVLTLRAVDPHSIAVPVLLQYYQEPGNKGRTKILFRVRSAWSPKVFDSVRSFVITTTIKKISHCTQHLHSPLALAQPAAHTHTVVKEIHTMAARATSAGAKPPLYKVVMLGDR